jgi:hypothetical protein
MRVRQIQELRPGARVVAEQPAQRARDHLRVLFLDAAHPRAKVHRLDHHANAGRLKHMVNRLGDLLRQPLLHLETTRIDFDDAG